MFYIRRLRGCEYETDSGIKAYFRDNFPDLKLNYEWRVPGKEGRMGIGFPSLAESRAAFAATRRRLAMG